MDTRQQKRIAAGYEPKLYRPEYPRQLMEYFSQRTLPYDVETVLTTGKSWTREERRRIPAMMPTIARFCAQIGIHRQRLYEWAESIPELADALARAKEWMEHLLSNGALMGIYDPKFAGLAAINWLGWRSGSVEVSGELTVQQLKDPGELQLLREIAQDYAQRRIQGKTIEIPSSTAERNVPDSAQVKQRRHNTAR